MKTFDPKIQGKYRMIKTNIKINKAPKRRFQNEISSYTETQTLNVRSICLHLGSLGGKVNLQPYVKYLGT